jgi:hypothetical protein
LLAAVVGAVHVTAAAAVLVVFYRVQLLLQQQLQIQS